MFASQILNLLKNGILKIDSFIRAHFKFIKQSSIVAILFIIIGAFCFFIFSYISYRINKPETDQKIQEWKNWLAGTGQQLAPPSILIYDRENRLMGEYLPERGSRISNKHCTADMKWLKLAAVSGEDQDFYHHGGVSWKGVFRAIIVNVVSLSAKQGGGSITQQVARNLFTDRSFTLRRKLLETFLAYDLESNLSKDEILCLYLNRIYMGEGRVGAEEASWFYYNKPPFHLTPAEAAMIVGIFPSPARYSPRSNLRLALLKQKHVLNTLVRDEYLKPEQVEKEINQFKKRYQIEDDNAGLIGLYGASRDFRMNQAPSANEAVREFLFDNLPEELIRKGGLSVYTTIDLRQQLIAIESARNQTESVRTKTLEVAKKFHVDDNIEQGIHSVIASITVPDGEIRALVGANRVTEGGSQISRIFSMKRQPGSAIKGYLYALSLDERIYSPYDTVIDEPVDIQGYKPRNWYRSYRGEIPLRSAVAWSVNTVAVKTLDKMGVEYFRNQLARSLALSISEADDRFDGNLSLALGTGNVSPIELAKLYAIILNHGRTIEPHIVNYVEDKDGLRLWQYAGPSSTSRIISQKAAVGTLWLLEGVVDSDEDGTAGWIGRLRKKNSSYMPYNVAGKSGTTQTPDIAKKKYNQMTGVRDSWFVGLVPGEVSVTWIGHDRGAPITGNAGVLWADYISKAHTQIKESFPDVVDYYGEEPEATDIENQNRDESTNNHPTIDQNEQIDISNDRSDFIDVAPPQPTHNEPEN